MPAPRSPPHPRGWSRSKGRSPVPCCVSPAPAGMVRSRAVSPAPRLSLPRTRGDGPDTITALSSWLRSPPHPRGWSGRAVAHVDGPAVSPAPAGMVLDRRWREGNPFSLPRTRGDGPWCRQGADFPPLSPPHPRGWSAWRAGAGVHRRVSPAPAGMVRRLSAFHARSRCLPRTRGDGPDIAQAPHRLTRSPPHPRGWSLAPHAQRGDDQVSPALAGMVPEQPTSVIEHDRLPRTRGDGPGTLRRYAVEGGSPPHPRGWSPNCRTSRAPTEVSPAPAGMVRL